MAHLTFLTAGGPIVLRPSSDEELADLVVEVSSQFRRDGVASIGWKMDSGDKVTYFSFPAGTAFMLEFDGDAPDDLNDRLEKARTSTGE